jgi:uncharacterized membrane protein
MSPYLHVTAALVALVLGATVLSMRKGTTRHRVLGGCYAGVLLLSNVAALTVTRATGGFGPFHVLAIISLATLAAGLLPMWLRPRSPGVIAFHAITLAFSYVGLVAAGLSQVVAQLIPSHTGAGVFVTSVAIFCVGAVLIFNRVPRALAHVGRHDDGAVQG